MRHRTKRKFSHAMKAVLAIGVIVFFAYGVCRAVEDFSRSRIGQKIQYWLSEQTKENNK